MGKNAKYRALRGMPDVLPEDAACMHWMEIKAREVFSAFGFKEIRTPLLEETQVFKRSIGEDTDIVEKEMYSFTDRGGKDISLRPEGTASIIRAYIENLSCNKQELTKLFYLGPMFRGERPQKGRLRQFHQIGAEMIGGKNPYIDAELIVSLDAFLKNLGIEGFEILVNSLGCGEDRTKYKKALGEYLASKEDELCENCRRRSKTNVLRVLDCKRPECKEIAKEAPAITGSLCDECLWEYTTLKEILTSSQIAFTEKTDLVRGLDYYTGTIFEVVHPAMGAQDAIAAGGRYDKLTSQMGGPDIGATGYAVGVERLMLIIDRTNVYTDRPSVVVVPVDESCRMEAFKAANDLRLSGISCEMDHSGRSLKAQMRKANKDGRRFVIMLGEEEIDEAKVLLKDMEEGEQRVLSLREAIEYLKKASSVKR